LRLTLREALKKKDKTPGDESPGRKKLIVHFMRFSSLAVKQDFLKNLIVKNKRANKSA
jgi:hypothetical protein